MGPFGVDGSSEPAADASYRALVNHLSDGIFIIDASGAVTFANRALATMMGFASAEALFGRDFRELVGPDQLTTVETLFSQLLAEGRLPEIVTTEILRADGQRVAVEVKAVPIVEDGAVKGAQGVIRDISARVREELRPRQMARAIEMSADTFVVTDRNGVIELVNPAFEEVTGYSAAEAVGCTPRILKSGRHNRGFYERLWRTIASGGVFRGTFVNRRKDGTLYHADETITPVTGDDGAITHFVATGRDVSSRVQLERQLRQAQKMQAVGRLAGGVAHDFNNMLTVIKGFAEFAREGLDPEDPAYADIEEIERTAVRAAQLVSQLLAFSRESPAAPEVLGLHKVLSNLSRMLERIVGEDVRLVLDVPEQCWPVLVDPTLLEQVIVNLAVNARDAMPNGGTLTIEVREATLDAEMLQARDGDTVEIGPGDFVIISVTDNGIGMARDVCEQVFEPFFTTKPKGAGAGLGLSTSYGIVQQAGGRLTVYSEPGAGSTFRIYLPRCPDSARTRPPDAPRATISGSETILVVEDEASVRAIAVRTLRARGYHVLEAGNGEEALLLADLHIDSIDLLLTDVVMPRLSGPELAERLRVLRPGLRVLLMSGYAERGLMERQLTENATAYLPKPFDPYTLALRVRQAIDADP